MRRLFARIALGSVFLSGALGAQVYIDPAYLKPGRDPNQPIDQEYTRRILENTTEKFFLSPLVDYLPASRTVPTPLAITGHIAGEKDYFAYSKDVYAYMRALEKASPRVKVFSIGRTEEGREMIAVAVASDSLIAALDGNRDKLAKLADPRTIGLDDNEAAKIVGGVTPVYYITGTIHSTESGAPSALMELAYRLAVDESPYVKFIRNNVITLITPIVEVDGRDRMVDLFNWHMKHPTETPPSLLYWGHYVAHDNNRDAMGLTLKLSQNVLNAYVGQEAQVLHDLHESVAYLYDNTIGDGPFNAWIDPLLTNEWQMIGWNNVQEMTRFGMPGVFAHGNFDTWSPGYLMFLAAMHNGISRLYETFGNGGTAETLERTLGPNDTQRTWYRQNPALPRAMWSLRNNNNYEQTGLLVSLNYFAANKRLFLQNFYEKSKRSVQKARTEGPAAYVFSANDPRLGAQAELLRTLQKQHVEISRATAPFSVTIPGTRAAAGGRGRGSQDSATASPRANAETETRQFPAGSYIVRMDQPYSRAADALLDHQYWAPNDPQKTPYDDTGWSYPEGFAVQALRVVDSKVLDAPMERVTGDVKAPGGIAGAGSTFVIRANADNALATLRYRLRAADMRAAEDTFSVNGVKFNRGSFIISKVPFADLDKAARELGLSVTAVAAAPTVASHPLRAARVAVMHTWTSTQTEGWWRYAFDQLEIPYDYISVQDISKTPDLNAKYDVIVFGPGGGGGQGVIEGLPKWRNPIPWKNTPETPNIGTWAQTDDMRPGLGWTGLEKLQAFVSRGGVLITADDKSEFAVTYGLSNGVSVNQARSRVVGSLLRATVVDGTSPIVYGVPENLSIYSDNGASLGVSASRGGRGGGRFGGGADRATGRGLPDDDDVVQGRPALDSSNKAIPVDNIQPWQYAVPTVEQMRNPLNIIPADQRPRVALRFGDARGLLASGLLEGGTDIAQRPVVVDSPVGKGHVVMFANNPIWRGETIGSYGLVLNAILNFDNLNAGRKLDVR